MSDDNNDRLLPAREVWQRFGVADRTIDRWLANATLGFPRPIYINNRRYFNERQIIAWEAAQARSKPASNNKLPSKPGSPAP